MERRRMVLAFAALLTVVALGFTAAAFDDGRTGGGGGVDTTSERTASEGSGSTAIATGVVVFVLVAAVAGVAYTVYQESMPRWLAVVLVLSLAVILALVGVDYILDPAEPVDQNVETTPEPAETPVPGDDGDDEGDSDAGGVSTTETLAVLGLFLLVGLVAVGRFTTSASPADEDDEPEEPTAVGEAAGRAADELETTTLSNAIYRAWREMTDALAVADPETTTPAEFEDAAVAAGIDREDVATLTDLFREVRYGDAPATPQREERAREALRRIEETYSLDPDDEAGEDR